MPPNNAPVFERLLGFSRTPCMKQMTLATTRFVPQQNAFKTSGVDICQAVDLWKRFGERNVLQNVYLSIGQGESVALMGPSGSGKSTLLNCLSGIDRPDSGTIMVGGLDVTSASPEELAQMRRQTSSTVFQFFHLLPTLTAYENIELSLQLSGLPVKQRKKRVEELLDAVKLAGHRDDFPETMSGGERQRVAIARALAHRPRLLLADEPTGSLDSQTGAAILDLLTSLTRKFGIAMLLVTHSAETAAVCRRTIHLRDGRIV